MGAISNDPVQNAINDGIKQGIRLTVENECFGSALTLIYSAIDTMAYLGMPESQQDVIRDDFVRWADRYIRFPCKEQIQGLEFYAARCAMLHNHGVQSRLSREGKVRIIGYRLDQGKPEVVFTSQEPGMVIVSVTALASAVISGIDSFLIDVFSDTERGRVADERLHNNVVCRFRTSDFPEGES